MSYNSVPGQTIQGVRDCFTIALKYPINNAFFNICMPYPGTELYDTASEAGLISRSAEDYMNDLDKKHGSTVMSTKEIPVDTMRVLIEESKQTQGIIKKRFYARKIRQMRGGSIPAFFYERGLVPDSLFQKVLSFRRSRIAERRIPV